MSSISATMVAPLCDRIALIFGGGAVLFFSTLRHTSSTAVVTTRYSLAEAECSFSIAMVDVILLDGKAMFSVRYVLFVGKEKKVNRSR